MKLTKIYSKAYGKRQLQKNKCKFFIWFIIHEGLNTLENLQKKSCQMFVSTQTSVFSAKQILKLGITYLSIEM